MEWEILIGCCVYLVGFLRDFERTLTERSAATERLIGIARKNLGQKILATVGTPL